jgi:ABC-type branched-subunit amino acid transport system substrate-binding protein
MMRAGRERERDVAVRAPSRRGAAPHLALALACALATLLAGCALPWAPQPDQILTIATLLPESGADAIIGQAMVNAVDLAVTQHATSAKGYRLAVVHVDEEGGSPAATLRSLTADQQVLGVVGPFDGQTASAATSALAPQHLVAISPSETLAAAAQSVPAPPGGTTPLSLLPPAPAAGQTAADLAVAASSAHGFAAHTVYVVDDGTPYGQAAVTAFERELKAKHGGVAGHSAIATGDLVSTQTAVSAIVAAAPDLVFFAGGTAAGAEMRATLTLSGVPALPMLEVGSMANNPGWGAAVGDPLATGNVAALLPAPNLLSLPTAKDFVAAYQQAYPGAQILPQSALAYDAAMDEITAIQSLLQAGKVPTRAAVLALVASAHYTGVTGTITFDQAGSSAASPGFSLYTCGTKGAWTFVATLGA